MDALQQALRGAQQPAAPAALAPRQRLLVLGAGGTLGSALLAEALGAGRFAAVSALAAAPLTPALRGLVPLPWAQWLAAGPLPAELALLVFERPRFSNRRDDAFAQPQPHDLLPWARRAREGGVRHLVVVVPHAPALLPRALAGGFADEEERATAELGFEHLVFLRAAQDRTGTTQGAGRLQRLADLWLAQLRWMVPLREQPVRAAALAPVVVALAQQLAAAPAGTRVLPQEWLWQCAQEPDRGAARLAAWLAR